MKGARNRCFEYRATLGRFLNDNIVLFFGFNLKVLTVFFIHVLVVIPFDLLVLLVAPIIRV